MFIYIYTCAHIYIPSFLYSPVYIYIYNLIFLTYFLYIPLIFPTAIHKDGLATVLAAVRSILYLLLVLGLPGRGGSTSCF